MSFESSHNGSKNEGMGLVKNTAEDPRFEEYAQRLRNTKSLISLIDLRDIQEREVRRTEHEVHDPSKDHGSMVKSNVSKNEEKHKLKLVQDRLGMFSVDELMKEYRALKGDRAAFFVQNTAREEATKDKDEHEWAEVLQNEFTDENDYYFDQIEELLTKKGIAQSVIGALRME